MTTETPTRLDIGSGSAEGGDCIRLDVVPYFKPDLMGTAAALPFADETIDEAHAHHVLEHIERRDLITVMNECWRVLKVGGMLDIEVPLFPSEDAMSDPTHVSFFTSRTFDYFIQGTRYEDHRVMYGIKPWHQMDRQRIGENSILWIRLLKAAE